MIVDHKLRPESTKEANFTKKILKKISINAQILTWKGKNHQQIYSQFQEKRDMNYYLKTVKNIKLNIFY